MLTIKTVLEAHDALVNLIKNDKELGYEIPKQARLTLAQNLNLAIPVAEAFSKVHNALVAKYGTTDKQGNLNVTDKDKKDAFFLERTNELEQESTVEAFTPVKLSDFPGNVHVDLIALMLRTNMIDINS